MKVSLLLTLLALSTVSFGQKAKGHFGALISNDFNFQGEMHLGLGMSHATKRQYVSVTMKIFDPFVEKPKLSFNRIQFDYRHYLRDKSKQFLPFATAGIEYYKNKERHSGFAIVEPKVTNLDYCDPDNPCNFSQELYYDYRSTEMNIALGIGLGADIRLVDELFFNFSGNLQYYDNGFKEETYYYSVPGYTEARQRSRNGFTTRFVFGMSYMFK